MNQQLIEIWKEFCESAERGNKPCVDTDIRRKAIIEVSRLTGLSIAEEEAILGIIELVQNNPQIFDAEPGKSSIKYAYQFLQKAVDESKAS